MMSRDDIAIWNKLGLVETNGAIIMPLETFYKALELARMQGRQDTVVPTRK